MQKGSGGVYKGFGFYMAYSMGRHMSQSLSKKVRKRLDHEFGACGPDTK